MLPAWLLMILVVAIVGYLAVAAPPQYLIFAAILFVMVPSEEWQVAGLRLDPDDLVLAGLLLAWASGRIVPHVDMQRMRPFMIVWAFLGIMLSASWAPQRHCTRGDTRRSSSAFARPARNPA